MVPQMWDEKTRAVTDCPYSTADERSRARKGADARIPAREAGSAQPTPARSGLRALPTLCAFAPLGRDWSAAILAAVPSRWMERVRAFYNPEGRAP